jgi:putative membrane-bound dehydrogenase-like protein
MTSPSYHLQRALRCALAPLLAAATSFAADSIQTKTTYREQYGTTKNTVSVNPASDLPRYAAMEPNKALESWKVKDGFELQLAAHEPLVRDPVAVCFDERGRMFACEMIDYPEFRDAQPHLGRISMLQDTDGDGVFETSSIFADNLPWPTGLIWANGGLYVAATPDIWRFEDKDGDGKAEVRKQIFTGFGTGLKVLNVQGMLNSMQWGQDNRVHLLGGGGNRGEIRNLARPETASEDIAGRDFWFDPLTHQHGFEQGGAQYGMSYDTFGRKFGCSNSDHLQHWVYTPETQRKPFFTMPASKRSIALDGGAAEVFRISPDEPWRIIRTRWRVAGTVPGAVEGGGRVSGYFTGATGTTIYKGDAYGPDFVNNSFTGDAGGQLVHRKKIRTASDGVNLEGERPEDERGFEFAASKDTWVRVVNFANAPDGCLYVCDMYREVIEHPWSIPDEIKRHLDLHSGQDRGRIYRIAPKSGAPRIGAKVQLADADNRTLASTLNHPNGWHRETAHRLLVERHANDAVTRIREILDTGSTPAKLHALGVLNGLGALGVPQIKAALADADAVVRERAIRLAGQHAKDEKVHPREERDELAKAVSPLANDPSPRVRFELALTLAALLETRNDTQLINALLQIASQDHAHPWIGPALLSAPEQTVLSALYEPFKANAESSPDALAFQTQLLELKTATASPAARIDIIRELTAGPTNPELLKALGQGLLKAGSSIEKADVEKRFHPIFKKYVADAHNHELSPDRRIMAIDLITLASHETALPALEGCLQANTSEAVQTAAIHGISKLLKSAAAPRILNSWNQLGRNAKNAAISTLTDRDENTIELLKAIQENKVPANELSAGQVQAILKSKNSEIVKISRKALASVLPQSRAEALAKYAGSITARGEALSGKAHFQQRCQTCHRAAGMGIEVGPDLLTVKTKGREALLTAILEPNKEVASAYIVYQVETNDGQSLLGFIAEDTADAMTLKMAGGATQTIKRNQIKKTSSAGQSLMPEGIETGMGVQDMADLLTFIESLP